MTNVPECEHCGRVVTNHMVFCIDATPAQQKRFFKKQMLSSMEKHWKYERDFKEITDSYIQAPDTAQFMSTKDREYQAANDPKRKAAAANAQYHMMRATMYGNAIQALDGM